jgi:hypothetical protein
MSVLVTKGSRSAMERLGDPTTSAHLNENTKSIALRWGNICMHANILKQFLGRDVYSSIYQLPHPLTTCQTK